MQWNLDETYHHPVIDSDKWNKKKGWPPNETASFFEVSEIEFRRRKLISETLNACESFKVDLLVLPEYSVRPDTVKWLRDQLLKKSGMPSVLAGTYMLHGNTDDLGFEETHKEILGLSDYQKAFGADMSSKGIYSSGEHSAMLTLLSPLELNDGKKIVCAFSRRKKYPSIAASEVFNPNLDLLRPLFSSEGLLEELQTRAADGSGDEIAQSDGGTTSKGRLGVTVRPMGSDERIRGQDGVMVERSVGAAARVGIRPGDVILSFNGKPVKSPEELQLLVQHAGQHAALLIQRNETRIFVPVELG